MAAHWSTLVKGDVIDVIAPGFPCSDDDLQRAAQYIQSLGLKPRIPTDTLGPDLICANSDEIRWKHLRNALTAKDSKMIWCVRGGYGSIRLLPQLAKLKKPKHPKLFWGYSDATSLHVYFNQKWGWPTVHGPLLDRLGADAKDDATRLRLKNVLFGESDKIQVEGLQPMNAAAKTKKKIKGPIIGGNMTVLASSLGTPWAFKAKKKILFLEDTGERAYKLDRSMQQFLQSKALDGIQALILGDFLGGPDKDGVSRVWPFWEEFASRVKFPIVAGMPAGHGEGQMPLPLNTSAILTLGKEASISCPTGI